MRLNIIKGTKGNDNLVGTEGKDKIFSGKGDDFIDAGAGNDLIFSGAGNDTVDGGAGHDCIHTGKGDDIVNGGEGNDYIHAGKGDDTVTGGAGDDFVHLGKGDDTAIYVIDDNVDSEDFYHGGRGQDTLRLEFTKEEWLRSDIQADIAAYLAFLNGDDVPDEYWHNRSTFEFNAFNLTAKQFENLEVVVDGVALNPFDEMVDAVDDDVSVTETSTIFGNVLTNDDVPDLVASVELVDDVTKGILTFNPDGSFAYDTNGQFEELAVGETATQTFTYKVIDADGDEDMATATIAITGENDAPMVTSINPDAVLEGNFSNPPTVDTQTVDVFVQTNINDPDTSDTQSYVVNSIMVAADITSATADLSLLTIDQTTGEVSYDRNAFNFLDDGESAIFNVTYDVQSGPDIISQTIAITILGENDAPFVRRPLLDPIDEDTPLIITKADFLSSTTEFDLNDQGSLELLDVELNGASAPYGTLVDNGDDTWTFTPSANFFTDQISPGFHIRVNFKVSDGTAAPVQSDAQFKILPVNDAPTVTGALEKTEPEDGSLATLDLLSGASDVEGDTLTITNLSTPLPAGLTLSGSILTIDPSDTSFQHLAVGDTEIINLSYDIEDGNGGSVAQTAKITITGTNDLPEIAAIIEKSANEDDASFAVDLLQGATDADAGETATLFVANVTGLTDGLVLAGNGVTVDPSNAAFQPLAQGVQSTITLTYDIVDAQGASVAQTAKITITGINDDPQIQSTVSSSSTEDDAAQIVDLLPTGAITDIDTGDVLSVVGGTLSQTGGRTLTSAQLNGNSLTYTPNEFNDLAVTESESLTFTYDVTDSKGGTVTQTLNLTIEGINDAPVTTAIDAGTVGEDDAPILIDLLQGQTDPDANDTLSIANIVAVDENNDPVTFTNNYDGTITIDPNQYDALNDGENRIVTVTYDVADGTTATQNTANLEVTGVNDAPVAMTDDATVDEDGTVLIDVLDNDSDANGDAFTITTITTPSNGMAVLENGQIRYTPTGNVSGVDSFTYTIDDGRGGTDTATVTININEIADEPTLTASVDGILSIDTPANLNIFAEPTDTDGSESIVQIRVAGLPTGSSLSAGEVQGDGSVILDPLTDLEGLMLIIEPESTPLGDPLVAFSVQTDTDGDGLSDIDELNLGTNPNNPDTDGDGLLDGIEINTHQTDPRFPDTDGGGVNDGDEVANGTNPRNDPADDFPLPDDFILTIEATVEDTNPETGDTDTTTKMITLDVDVNAAPVAVEDSATVDEDGSVLIDVLDNDSDVDGDTPSITNITTPTNGTAVIENGQIRYTPTGNFSGVASFAYTIDDGKGGTDTTTVTINVDEIADQPTLTAEVDGRVGVDAAQPLNIMAAVTDLDGSEVITQIKVSGLPVGASLNNGTVSEIDGSILLNPSEFDGDLDGLLIQVEDPTVTDFTLTIEATVTDTNPETGDTDTTTNTTMVDVDVNAAPVAEDLEITTNEDTAVTIDALASASDPDGDDLTLELINTSPQNGTVEIINNEIVYTPNAEFSGQDSFDYRVSDDFGGSSIKTVSVNVTPDADTPTLEVSLDGEVLPLGTAIGLDIQAMIAEGELNENPSSEQITQIKVSGLPAGVSLSAGVVQMDGSVILTPAELSGLELTVSEVPAFGASFDLGALNGSNGFTLNGIDATDSSGWSVSGAGDINGDGIDDLIIGAPGVGPGDDNAGESYVVFGQDTVNGPDFGASLDLSTLNGSNGFTLNGIDATDSSGWSVSGAGDINGDGIDDLIIGAPGVGPFFDEAGESYVVFGQDTVNGPGFGASFDLGALNGSNGFILNGINEDDRSGISVSGAGDINGDGIDDLIIGADRVFTSGAGSTGESYVVFGQDTVNGPDFGTSLDLSTLNGSNGFTLKGFLGSSSIGWSVSGAGDINEDGIDDLIIGAYVASPNGVSAAGQSYVVFGQDTVNGPGFGAALDLSTLNGSNGFTLNGIDAIDLSGWSVSGAGDINGDGIDDLIIGAVGADQGGDTDAGESYVVFGQDTVNGPSFGATLDLGALNGSNGFTLNGLARSDRSGTSVSGAGDINGDGIDDLIIGANLVDTNIGDNAGESYVVFGQDTVNGPGFDASLDLSTLNGSNGFVFEGIYGGGFNGSSVSGAGDINGDGIDDLIIGAYGVSSNGDFRAGESYVVFGRQGLAPDDFQLTVEATIVDTNLDNPSETDTTTVSTTLDVDVNQNPTIEAASFTVDENQQDVGTITFSDPDGDDVTISLTSNNSTDNALFEIDGQTGLLTFISENGADFENPLDIGMDSIYDIEVEVSDDKGGSTIEQFQVTVDDVGQAVLEFSNIDGNNPFNFGLGLINQITDFTFSIENSGDDFATDIVAAVDAPFAVTGGTIIGLSSLAPNSQANIEVTFTPLSTELYISYLNIGYEGGVETAGMISLEVQGTGL